MKQLILVRHGKSSWEINVRDHDRVLLQRGIDDAHLIAAHLQDLSFNPQIIWSSSAARALQTATIIAGIWDYNLELLKVKRSLYTFDYHDFYHVVSSCNDTVDSLAIFGHNYGITDFVNTYGTIRFDNVPTAGVVVLEFDVTSWADIHKGSTIFKIFPKDLK